MKTLIFCFIISILVHTALFIDYSSKKSNKNSSLIAKKNFIDVEIIQASDGVLNAEDKSGIDKISNAVSNNIEKKVIKNIKYLGAVEVVESNDKYYQLRYIARVNKVHRFKEEWEINERKFVKLEDLKKYIKWCDGVTFKAQLDTALRVLSEGYVDSSISA